jgi:hypothetical protein
VHERLRLPPGRLRSHVPLFRELATAPRERLGLVEAAEPAELPTLLRRLRAGLVTVESTRIVGEECGPVAEDKTFRPYDLQADVLSRLYPALPHDPIASTPVIG